MNLLEIRTIINNVRQLGAISGRRVLMTVLTAMVFNVLIFSVDAQDLSTNGWRMWPDTNASWQSDTIYLPEDVVLSNLPVNPPTGGWGVLNDTQGIPVTLPATVEQYYWDQLPGETDANGSYHGVSWWWCSFQAPVLQPGQHLIIHFRAARMRAEVYCNQQLCGYNLITEIPFDADITSAVQQGTTNLLAVRITNPGGSPDWRDIETSDADAIDNNLSLSWGTNAMPLSHDFGGVDAGIVMEVRDPVNVDDFAVLNRPNPQEVWVIGSVTNSGATEYNGPLALSIMDSNSIIQWQTTNTIFVSAGGQTSFSNDVVLPNVTLWNLTNPVLYSASAAILGSTNSGQSVDFGFRWFTPDGIGSNALLRLNSKRIVLRSAISWGFWEPNGLFPNDASAQKEVTAAKTLGLNCLHFHRNIGHPDVFDAQDRMGLLRYEEPGAGFNAWSDTWWDNPGIVPPTASSLAGIGGTPDDFRRKYETDKILAMVKRDRSHPSLVIYGLQNENTEGLDNPHIFWLLNQMRQIDPSRTVVLHSGIPAYNEVLMMPYSTNFLYEDGTGYSGWSDIHTWGGPGNYEDDLYISTNNYSHYSSNAKEIVTWGEMLGMGVPDDHEAIVEAYQTNHATGYDLSLHQAVLSAYDQFLDRWDFRPSFPTASSLFQAIGQKSYFTWARVIEAARACDQNDILVISGWESTSRENHSGIVDTARNFRTDPTILSRAMAPEVLVIRPKRFVLKPGDQANVDVLLVNETDRTGPQTLTFTASNPDGSTLFSQQVAVNVAGGDVYGQPLAANFTFTPNTNGTVLLTGVLQPNGGTGDTLTNTMQLLVVDPTEGSPLMSRIAVCEVGDQIKSLLSNTFGVTALGSGGITNLLDAIVMGSSGAPSWSYSAYNVSSSIANTTDDGLYQNQFYGPSGVVQTWFGFAPGNVTVQLCFAETYWNAANSRLFDVALNGNTVLTNFDIFAQAGGMNRALVKTFTVNASDGTVSLSFPTVEKDNAQIAGIKMTDASNNVVAVAFSTSPFTDHNGLVWQPLSSFPTHSVPVTTAQWQTILGRVSNDGVRLVLWPNNITETMTYVNLLAAANLLQIGTYDDITGNYTGYLPDNTPSWMGSWYFARQHWLMDDLPTDTVLGWQYQIPHGTGQGGGMLINPAPGCPMDVMIGYGRDNQAAVAIGACVIQSGKGQIVLPSIPRLRDALSYYDGSFLTQPTALRLFGNALRAEPASVPLSPPPLIGVPQNGQAVLKWSDAFGATSCNLKRALVSGGAYTVIASNLTSTIYTNTGLANGTTYFYVVSGVNTNGESSNSAEVAVTPRTDGLVGYWKFDETSGVIATDSVGGNDGTLSSGATWAAGIISNAVSLNGTGGSYVSLPGGIVSTLNDFSITTWVYVNANNIWARIFDFGSGTTEYMYLVPDSSGNTTRYAITTSSTSGEQTIDGPILSTGAWHHVAVTQSGTTGTLYVDGVAVGTNTSMTLNPASLGLTAQNYIGRSQWNDPNLNGEVDDFRIYNRALSASEIATMFNVDGGTPAAPYNLVAIPGNGQVGLSWTASSGASSYNMKRATASGGPYATITNITSPAFTDTGLVNGATYYYVVSAVNIEGEGTNSTQAVATPFSSPPTVTLLNISDSTYPTVCTVSNYQAVGVAGLAGNESISQFAPTYNSALTSPMILTNGGQVIYMSSTANGKAYAKNTGPGGTSEGGLLDLYLYTSSSTARTMTVSNLNLSPGFTYTLYLIGYVPNNTPAEDGLFTPVNTPNITFASTASGQAILAVQFTTSSSLISTDTLKFTWARAAASGDGVFDGLAIVPVTSTWNGAGADNNWSTGLNWVSGMAPSTNAATIIFAGSARLTPNMETNYNVASLTFDGTAGSFSIGAANGSTLTLSGNLSNNSTSPQVINVPVSLSGSQTINAIFGGITLGSTVNNNGNLLTVGGTNYTVINGAISGSGGLVKIGSGMLSLNGTNTYTGDTTLNAGTLTVAQATLATNGIFTIANGAKLQLGFSATNRINGLVLNGVTQPDGIYNSNSTPNYISGAGSLLIGPPIATNATNLVFTVSGGALTLAWPADHTGWQLQAQTNHLDKGLGTNWFDVPGSSATNRMNLPVDSQSSSVFYRLKYP